MDESIRLNEGQEQPPQYLALSCETTPTMKVKCD